MKVGVTLPAMIPGVGPDTVLEWARRADAGPFSSIALGERLLWPGYDLMVTLAAVAAVTRRVRVVSTVVVLPLHSAVVVAKQAATLDQLSGGRLTLGVGIGGRDDDFHAAGAPFEKRHARMEEQVAHMRRIWRGEPAGPGLAHVGPRPLQPNGPEILAGSVAAGAVRRVARWADGLSAWSFEPDVTALEQSYRIMSEAWREAERPGAPRFVAGFWYALGPGAAERIERFVSRYLAYFGDKMARRVARSITTSNAGRVKEILAALADIGTDEAIPVPVSADLEQLERLAELVR
jgi:alkanesulfonate monooxygenase SsuD/methylene tetrahydromethanopterin reductase-like flavin-dependent oxidoreductase (luciferase family)